MRSTLFYIPAQIAGTPVFGFGWLFWAWIVVSAVVLFSIAKKHGWGRETAAYVPLLLIVAAVIYFLLPGMVESLPGGPPLGIPVRGFGVMLMLATIAGVGLAAYRARQMGLDPEVIYSLAFCMFIAGILGARLFYIVQYWNDFRQPTLSATLQSALNVTKGGLVVYGSVLAGVPAGIWFLVRRGLPVLAIGDIIAPSMVVGLALGRVGCFLNGCCFGGECLAAPYAVTFPGHNPPQPTSPPYLRHEQYGWRSGVWLAQRGDEVVVAYVAPDSPASLELKAGERIVQINGAAAAGLAEAQELLTKGKGNFEVETGDGRIVRWSASGPPARSVPVHAAQLYAAIDAGLLALLLWAYYPFRRRDGEVFALLVTVHPISRFLLEMVRSDEPGQFGTELTISQWLSIAILAAACALWWYVERQPRGSALPLST
jgi:phosphatidylglycerol:prolipoprotein diacylglycerol transferase